MTDKKGEAAAAVEEPMAPPIEEETRAKAIERAAARVEKGEYGAGLTVNHWQGMDNHQCLSCAYADLNGERALAHVRDAHGPAPAFVLAATAPPLVDRFGQSIPHQEV